MPRSSNSQQNTADATPRFPYASRKSPRIPYTSQTTGVSRLTLPCVPVAHAALLTSEAEAYLGGRNRWVAANRIGAPAPVETHPIAQRGARDARRATKKTRHGLRMRSEARMGTLPVVGAAVAVLGASLDREGTDPTLVLNARFRKVAYGTGWVPCITVQGEPKERNLMGFRENHPRPSYCADIGVAVMPDGLHVSEMSIRDAKGTKVFITGKKPTRYIVPFTGAKEFVDQLLQRKVRPRSLTLDRSCVAILSRVQKVQTRALVVACREQLAVGAVVYREVSPVGQEFRETKGRWLASGAFTARELDQLLSPVPVECPRCEAPLSLKLNPLTGLPRVDHRTLCTLCGYLADAGDLLADRARDRGVAGWEVNIAPAVQMVTVPDPFERANAPERTAAEEKNVSSFHRPSSKPRVVSRNATKLSRPSQGDSAPTRGHHDGTYNSATHTKQGLVRRIPREGRKSQRPAQDEPKSTSPFKFCSNPDVVSRNATKLSRPSQGDSAQALGHVQQHPPVTHKNQGLVSRAPREGRKSQRPAQDPIDLLRAESQAYFESISKQLGFTEI